MGKSEEITAVRVTAAVVRHEGRLLITRRKPGGTWGGYWEFPGGKVEPGETDAQALKRELLEETGLKVEPERLIYESRHRDQAREVVLLFYGARPVSGTARPLQVEECRWVLPSELKLYPFPTANEPLIPLLQGAKD